MDRSDLMTFAGIGLIIVFLALGLILGGYIGLRVMYMVAQSDSQPGSPVETPLITPAPTQVPALAGPTTIKASSGDPIAYICSPDGKLHVVDTGSRSTIAVIPFNTAPDAGVPSKDGKKIYVANAGH